MYEIYLFLGMILRWQITWFVWFYHVFPWLVLIEIESIFITSLWVLCAPFLFCHIKHSSRNFLCFYCSRTI